jgi:hypothetical protein
MCLDLDGKLMRERKNPFQTTLRFERREREKEVGETVTPGQSLVYSVAIQAVYRTLLVGLK